MRYKVTAHFDAGYSLFLVCRADGYHDALRMGEMRWPGASHYTVQPIEEHAIVQNDGTVRQ
jgi:hypothetical protein